MNIFLESEKKSSDVSASTTLPTPVVQTTLNTSGDALQTTKATTTSATTKRVAPKGTMFCINLQLLIDTPTVL